MKYSSSLLVFLAVILLFSCKEECPDDPITAGVNPTNRNVLLVIADDMGLDATPGYPIGAVKPSMPNLEALMNSGLTFENAWTDPICSPTRAQILTGRYGYRTGVLNPTELAELPVNERTLHAYLDEMTNEHYAHSIFGKWHLGGELGRPEEMGIGTYSGIFGGGINSYESWPLTENATTTISSEYTTTKLTDLASSWINQQDRPWFCWLAYNAPHTPFHLPPDELHQQGALSSDPDVIDANPLSYYMAALEALDTEMGRLFESIPANELAKTTIIFIGDNGSPGQVAQSPYTSDGAKGTLLQGGVHVPMVISGSGVSRAGEQEDALVSSVDLFSTISNLLGIAMDDYEDSVNFMPLLSDGNAPTREFAYVEIENGAGLSNGYAIRNERYKLIGLSNGGFRLFDLQVDPYETNTIMPGQQNDEEAAARQELLDAAALIRQ